MTSVPGYPVPEIDPVFDMPFIDPIIGFSYGRRDLDTSDDDDTKWFECIDRCGINQDTQAAIIDPVFRRIRLTESCLFWIRDTIESRYQALEEIQKASREREQAILRAALRPGGSASASRQLGGLSSSGRGAGTSQLSIFQTMRMAPGISQDTAMSEAALRLANNAPSSVTLYKGLDKGRLDGLFDNNGNIRRITTLSSAAPTDFSGAETGYYFAVHREIAVYYATYAKRRSDVSSVVIVHATIQNSTIESLPDGQIQRVYWPSEEWKRLVFNCRTDAKLPSDLRKFKQASLIIGTIASKPNKVYVNMDSHSAITEKMVLKTKDRRKAVQYVFRNSEGRDLLEEKAELKVFPVTTAEYNKWHRDAEEESE